MICSRSARANGVWCCVSLLYEKDRLDPVDTSAALTLDRDKLARMPAGYRHLAYLQLNLGMNVKLDLPGTRGPAVDALYAQGQAWLAGATA